MGIDVGLERYDQNIDFIDLTEVCHAYPEFPYTGVLLCRVCGEEYRTESDEERDLGREIGVFCGEHKHDQKSDE